MKQLTNILIISMLALLSARFLATGWGRLPLNANSADGDQGAYLQLGLTAREQGLITDGKRPPLYPLLLAGFAEREWAYFTWAKIINLALGLLTVLATYAVGRHLFNPLTGLLAAALLSINMEFILHSTFVLAETALIFSVLMAWFSMSRALQKPQKLRYWAMAGLFSGLAILAKGTGPIFVVCFLLIAGLLLGLKLWHRRGPWLYAATLLLTISPLLIFNMVNFGTPFYNAAIYHVMWMNDSADEYVAADAERPTLSNFLAENSPAEIISRLSEGLGLMRYFFLKLLWPTRSVAVDGFYQSGQFDLLLLGLLISMGAAYYFQPQIFQRNRAVLLLTASFCGAFYILFAWYIPIAPYPIRFLLPLAPPLFIIISAACVGLGQQLFEHDRLPRWSKVGVAMGLLYLSLQPVGWFGYTTWLITQSASVDPFAADAAFNQHADQPLQWLRQGHATDAPLTVLWGPSQQLPVWRHTDRFRFIRTPVAQLEHAAQLEQFMDGAEISYIIVDNEMTDHLTPPLRAAWGLSEHENRVQLGTLPSDWALGYVQPDIRCTVCVFRRLSAAPPEHAVDFWLADKAINLIGYDLETSLFQPGGQLLLTLYWEAQHATATDLTIFTQLLGPDFQLHGQLDRQPLAGQWPTSRWQAGQKFVDKFAIPIAKTAPPGEYQLLVGLYDLESGQRAMATQNGTPLANNAIVLHTINQQPTLP